MSRKVDSEALMNFCKLRHYLRIALCLLCLITVGFTTTWIEMKRSLLYQLQESLQQAIASIDITLNHGQVAAEAASQWLGKSCDDNVLTAIRTLVATIPDVRTLNLVKGNDIYCTSVFGGKNFKINTSEYINGKLLLLNNNAITPSRSLIVYRYHVRSGNSVLAGIDGYYLYNILRLLQNETEFYLIVGNKAMTPQGFVTVLPHLDNYLSFKSNHYDYQVVANKDFIYRMTTFIRHEKTIIAMVFIFSLSITFLFSRYLMYQNTMESLLRNAIKKKQIVPWIQPIVSAKSGCLIGGEVLLRWHHPVHGFIPPDVFIAAAEQNGMIKRITRDCFSDVTEQLVQSDVKNDNSLIICFNVSADNFVDEEIVTLCQTFNDKVSKYGFCVALEITERDSIEKTMQTLNIIEQLKKSEVKISLDDFGTGNANYNYLSIFTPDYIKIDKIFTSNIQENNLSLLIVKNILNLANSVGCDIIAEGVETKEQQKILSMMGVAFFQGYYFSRPIPVSEFIEMTINNNYKLDSGGIGNPR